MSRFHSVFWFGFLILLAHNTYGDIAPGRNPLPKPPVVAPVKIEQTKLDDLGPNVVAKIVIPSSLLPDLLEPPYGQKVSHEGSAVRAVIAGLGLTAAAISLMVVKANSSRWRKTAVGVIISATLFGGILLRNLFFLPAPGLSAGQSTPQQLIAIEIQRYGHEVTLVLPNHYNGLE